MAEHAGSVPVPDMRPTLDKIGRVVKNWYDILGNLKESPKWTLEEYQFLVNQIRETENEWKTLVQESQALHKSVYTKTIPDKPAIAERTQRVVQPPQNTHLQQCIDNRLELSVELDKGDMHDPDQSHRIQSLEYDDSVMKKQMKTLEEKNKALTLRPRQLAADKPLINKPNFAELSDPKRPTKLGEVYSELYDNEYTDAHTALVDHGYTEREAIDILRETILNAYEFCSEKAMLTTTEEALNRLFHIADGLQAMNRGTKVRKFALVTKADIDDLIFALKWKSKDRSKQLEENRQSKQALMTTMNKARTTKSIRENQIKELIRETGFSMVSTIRTPHFKERWDRDCIVNLKPFVKKCILITWIMSIQTPPMVFLEVPPAGKEEELNSGQYRAYTKSGKVLDYVVWPAMMLTKDGPIIMKGVAQGK